VSVRCGLLHEARTKGTWRIHDKNEDKRIVKPGPILYRDVLQRGIVKFIADYVAAVPKDSNLQAAFIRKYEHLCRATAQRPADGVNPLIAGESIEASRRGQPADCWREYWVELWCSGSFAKE